MIDDLKRQDIENRIKYRHRGGVNNSKGADYENFYETYKIVKVLSRWYNNHEDAIFQAQKECLIDDFWIHQSDSDNYYQLKNVQSLSWTKSLVQDFKDQALLCEENNENYELSMVYSNSESTLVNVPKEIQPYTTAEYFPYSEHLNKLIWISDAFREALQEICSEEDPGNDVLADIASVVLAEWCKGEKNKVCKASEFACLINNPIYPKLKGAEVALISEKTRALFKHYNIEYRVSLKWLNWSWNKGMMSGEILWNKEKEEMILSKEYESVIDLISNLI